MERPEEIYEDLNGKKLTYPERLWGEGTNRRRVYDLGHETGYAKCLADQANPLAGYSNLTEAIKAVDPIDYEKLDGLKVRLVHPEMGTLHGTLNRDKRCAPDSFYGWWDGETDSVYIRALCPAWSGTYGWTLWIEGEIPLIRKTADQLEIGTYFLGKLGGRSIDLMYVGRPIDFEGKTVHYTPDMNESTASASEWVVLEEYGPFQKPEDK